jgi:hypothetical protein
MCLCVCVCVCDCYVRIREELNLCDDMREDDVLVMRMSLSVWVCLCVRVSVVCMRE